MRRIIWLSVIGILLAGLGILHHQWSHRGPIAPSGGLPIPGRLLIEGPHFSQGDPRWKDDRLGSTAGSLGAEGCAVASAAMVLGTYGVDTDPARLNAFLTGLPGGYTPQGWIYWEKAAEFVEGLPEITLPHYEDLPSYKLIDINLLAGNPVIARVRQPSGITHFVVITGKSGAEYLIRDPALPTGSAPVPLSSLGSPVEAIRFYRQPPSGFLQDGRHVAERLVGEDK